MITQWFQLQLSNLDFSWKWARRVSFAGFEGKIRGKRIRGQAGAGGAGGQEEEQATVQSWSGGQQHCYHPPASQHYVANGRQIPFNTSMIFSWIFCQKEKAPRCRASKWLRGPRNLPWRLAEPAFTPRRRSKRFESCSWEFHRNRRLFMRYISMIWNNKKSFSCELQI